MTQEDFDRLKENWRQQALEDERHNSIVFGLLNKMGNVWTEERKQAVNDSKRINFAVNEKLFVERSEILNRCDHRNPDGTDAYEEGWFDIAAQCTICGEHWDKVEKCRSSKSSGAPTTGPLNTTSTPPKEAPTSSSSPSATNSSESQQKTL